MSIRIPITNRQVRLNYLLIIWLNAIRSTIERPIGGYGQENHIFAHTVRENGRAVACLMARFAISLDPKTLDPAGVGPATDFERIV